MQTRAAVMVAAAAGLLTSALFLTPQLRLEAQGSTVAFAGEVSSKEEGRMEGVAVTAEREGASFRVSVYTNAQGQYSFPRSRIVPGKYTLTIRATGYDLVPPGPVEVVAAKPATANLTLQKTADLTRQLSSREWALSMPGPDLIKHKLVATAVSCTYCHSLERVLKTKYTAQQWIPVLTRMQKYFVDGTASPQGTGRGHVELETEEARARAEKNPEMYGIGNIKVTKVELAEYLASVNLSAGRTQFPFELKALPRPKGAATRIMVTQWDLPRKDTVVHDGETDSKARVWFNSENTNTVGMLDTKTNTFAEYPLTRIEPNAHPGSRDIIIDKADNVWMVMRLQGGGQTLYKFNTTTYEVTPVEGLSTGAYGDADPSGTNVWLGFVRVDAKTAKINGDFRRPPTGPRPNGYGFVVSSKGNAYGTDYMGSAITAIDVAKNEGKSWPTPRPNMLPRRGRMDSQDRFWMAFYGGDAIGMLDTKTEKWTEWKVPITFTTPYTATVPDRQGYVYSPTHTAEAVLRLNPKTGEFLEYAMPTTPGNFDGKKVSYDPTAKNTTILFSNPRNAQIIRVEFLD